MARRSKLAPRRRVATSTRQTWRASVPWPVAAAFGAVATAGASWLVCVALCLVGWLSATDQPLSGPLHLATSLFLLGNGAHVVLGGVAVSIPPLLLTFGFVACGLTLVRAFLRHGFAGCPIGSTKQVATVAGVVAGVYGLLTAVLAGATQTGGATSGLIGGLVVGFVIGWWAAAPLFGWRLPWPTATPAWVMALPRAVGAGLAVLGAGGCLVVMIALISSRSQVGQLQASLLPSGLGGVVLAIGQALWAPTLAVWGVAWMVGAGFSVGVGTLVSPVAVELGVLPSVPLFGALPTAGSPSPALLMWLVVPVAAGITAAWVALRAQASADSISGDNSRVDIGVLVGGAAGILTGFAATGLAALTRGDLGQSRLIGLGPILGTMALLAPSLLGLAGALAGLVITGRRALALKPAATVPVKLVQDTDASSTRPVKKPPSQPTKPASQPPQPHKSPQPPKSPQPLKPPPQPPKPIKPPPQPWRQGASATGDDSTKTDGTARLPTPKGHIA